MAEEKPRFEDLTELKEKAVESLSGLRKLQNEDDDYYEGHFNAKIEEPFWEVRPATPRALIDSAIDHTVTMNPIATVPPRKDTPVAQANADLLEQGYQGWLNLISQDSPDPLREAGSDCYLRGEFYYKIVYDPMIGDDRFPIRLLAPEPMTIYPSPDEEYGEPSYVFEIYQRTVADIMRKYPNWKPNKSYKPYENVEWVEYWSPKWRCFWADEIPVLKGGIQPNIYKRVPYIHGYSGLGRKSKDGKPEKLVVGLLRHLHSMFGAEVRLLSFIDSVIGNWAMPRIYGDEDVNADEIDMSPGTVTKLPGLREGAWKISEGFAPPGAVFQYIGLINSLIQEGGISKSLQGQAPQGVDVGYMYALLVGQARLRFGAPMKNMQVGLERALGFGAYLIENVIKKPVTVQTMRTGKFTETTIKPEDFNGYYKVNVKLEPIDPQLNDQKSLLGFRLWQGGGISHSSFLEEYAGKPNATREMANIVAEKTVMSEEFAQVALMAAVKKFGIEEVIGLLKAQQQKGAGSQPGVPEGPQLRDTTVNQDNAIRRQQRLGQPGGSKPMEDRFTRPAP